MTILTKFPNENLSLSTLSGPNDLKIYLSQPSTQIHERRHKTNDEISSQSPFQSRFIGFRLCLDGIFRVRSNLSPMPSLLPSIRHVWVRACINKISCYIQKPINRSWANDRFVELIINNFYGFFSPQLWCCQSLVGQLVYPHTDLFAVCGRFFCCNFLLDTADREAGLWLASIMQTVRISNFDLISEKSLLFALWVLRLERAIKIEFEKAATRDLLSGSGWLNLISAFHVWH